MTAEENRLIAEAQAAMHKLRRQVPGDRGQVLMKLALIGLLEAELEVEHEDLEI